MNTTADLANHHRIEIERLVGSAFRVRYQGRVLIRMTHDPEFDACRALLQCGVRGMLVSRWRGSGTDCLRIDIERGAAWTVRGSKLRRYVENAVPQLAGRAKVVDGSLTTPRGDIATSRQITPATGDGSEATALRSHDGDWKVK